MQPIRSKAQLFVTTKPTFNQFSNKAIVEGENLGINCSATGIPTPNITWVYKGNTNEIKSQGVGHAYLVIKNISRKEEGIYACQATNNPNKVPVIKETQVTVLYKPHFFISTVFNNENKITILCLVSGQPAPLITWYDALGKIITSGTRDTTGGSELTLETTNISDDVFGQYTCNATNEVGYQVHFISVTRNYFLTSKDLITKFGKKVSMAPTVYKNKFAGPTTSSELLNNISTIMTPYSCNKEKVNIILALVSGVVVSILITISIFLAIKLRRRYNRNEVENNGKKTERFFSPTQAPVNEDVISLSPMAPVFETTPQSSMLKARNDDYEQMSDKSVAPSSIDKTAKEDKQKDIDLQETQHQYQELNDASLILNKQVYQSLDRTGDVAAQVEPVAVAEQKYEPLKFANKTQSSEYQKLYLYANIELDKK